MGKKIILLSISLIFLTACGINAEKRYTQIKENFEEGLNLYLNDAAVQCEEDARLVITSDFLISQGYIKKKILLDVDKKSYCDVNAEIECKNGKNDYKTYIKCKDYVSEGYRAW